ncbi:MAG TPA: hypothetical protein VF453_09470 [Burkholderiaceae bacterium]
MSARKLLNSIHAAGMAIVLEGERLIVRPGSLLTSDLRESITAMKPELVRLLQASNSPAFERPHALPPHELDRAHADAWGEEAIVRFVDRVGALRGAGLGEQDAEDLAERLHLRDLDGADQSVCVVDCKHYSVGLCRNHREASISHELGAFATTPQRCPGIAWKAIQ